MEVNRAKREVSVSAFAHSPSPSLGGSERGTFTHPLRPACAPRQVKCRHRNHL